MQSLSLWLITFIFAAGEVQSRLLRLNSSGRILISDGVDRVENQNTYVKCEHLYGFFPCADNVGGFIFLIAIYQYLLIVGERLVSDGSKKIFNILGTGIFGATLFQILKAFPRSILVIASGVFCSKEKAQNLIYTGVSTNVGATVFNLTLMWGICVIFGSKEEDETSTSQQPAEEEHEQSTLQRPAESSLLNRLQALRNNGVTIDKKTNYTAGIMLLSLIPFVLVELVNAFNTYSGRRIVIVTTLVVSVTFMLSYFTYQLWDPWIQERSLQYSKYENLLSAFVQHVQRHAKGTLIDEKGLPDIHAIQRLFAETDRDADKSITHVELENLVTHMQSGEIKVDKSYAIYEILKAFDLNKDGKIDEYEFVEGCKKWIEKSRMSAKSGDSTLESSFDEGVLAQEYTKDARDQIAKTEQLMAKILKHLVSQALKVDHIIKDDGSPDIEQIKEIFHGYDTNEDKNITRPELKKLLLSIKYGGEVQLDSDDAITKVMKDFDKDGNGKIDEQEFIHTIKKWLNEAIRATNCKDKTAIDEYDKMMWGEVDKLVYDVEKDGKIKYKLLTWAFNKSIFQVILGIAMLAFCSKPLINSIQKLSEAIGMPSFLIPFVIVPIALNARMAIAAIFPASQKSSKTASLTFSEIYGGVIMDNIMGMAALLAVVCAKQLTWDYSAQVIIVLVACAVIGLFALFSNKYPLWTCFLAFSLYPSCVVLFYILQRVL